MYGLHLLLWLCSLALAAQARVFDLAVRSSKGDVQKWATLQVDTAAPASSFIYTPVPGAAEVSEGCLGVLEPTGFVCQSLFRSSNSSRQALDAVLTSDGALLQARFVVGPPSKAYIQLPSQVPRPVLKPMVRAPGSRAQQKGGQQRVEEVGAEEPEKSLVEKYWIYAVPIGLLIISNVLSPGAAAE